MAKRMKVNLFLPISNSVWLSKTSGNRMVCRAMKLPNESEKEMEYNHKGMSFKGIRNSFFDDPNAFVILGGLDENRMAIKMTIDMPMT